MAYDASEVSRVISEMRTRMVNNGRHPSDTLRAWADRLEAAHNAKEVRGLVDVARRILGRLQHPTQSVHAGHMWELEDRLQSFQAVPEGAPPSQSAELLTRLTACVAAMEAAHDSLFGQCASNPITNAWGKPVDCTAINNMQTVAREAKKLLTVANAHPGESNDS